MRERKTRAMGFSSVTAAATGVALAAIFFAVCAPFTDAREVVAAKKQEMDYYEGILHACPVHWLRPQLAWIEREEERERERERGEIVCVCVCVCE